eukprot:1442458-Karenia_brevis.AAC.1
MSITHRVVTVYSPFWGTLRLPRKPPRRPDGVSDTQVGTIFETGGATETAKIMQEDINAC